MTSKLGLHHLAFGLATFGALFWGTLSVPLSAAPLAAACAMDIRMYCLKYRPEDGLDHTACLQSVEIALNPECKEALHHPSESAASFGISEDCRLDAEKVCPKAAWNTYALTFCLASSDNEDRVSKKCQDSLLTSSCEKDAKLHCVSAANLSECLKPFAPSLDQICRGYIESP